MIIDCHGHYTTAPVALQGFRDRQVAAFGRGNGFDEPPPTISDAEIHDSIAANQLRLMDERGTDLTILSPKASAMAHHVPDVASAAVWARANNELIQRVTAAFPGRFAGVAQLPQAPGAPLDAAVAELRRCVEELRFVGCNLNADPSGGLWTGRPLVDEYWFPLYEAMVELDVPAMIHVSSSINPNFHTLGAHYLMADTAVYMQFVEHDLFDRFPTLRFVIPHGGGAVPYHWGRFRGLAQRLGRPDPSIGLAPNVFFDTCVYQAEGIELLLEVVGTQNVLFASEMLGAVPNCVDPESGDQWDDTKRYLDRAGLGADQVAAIFSGNAMRVYPRLETLASA
jgi:4-oxalmesaconate hydratase